MKTQKLKKGIPNGIHLYCREQSLQLLFCILMIVLPLQYILAHGTVTYPPSRVWICYQENPESPDSPACEASIIGWGTQAFYDWNEVARMDANGMHRDIIPDGNLASAGRPDKYGGLDQVRDDWVTTEVQPGPFTVTWTNNVPHKTLYYDVYITKADWTPDQPLTWDSLELLVRTGPRDAAGTDNIEVELPFRTGKHVLYSIWQRSLTPEAFYATSDIDFGSDSLPNVEPIATFTSDNGICGGSEVSFSAADSYDPNGDQLTYSWDFGDGTTAEGVEVSHTYAGIDSATVTLTVSDGEFSSGATEVVDLLTTPGCIEPVCPFDTPTESPLPSTHTTYSYIYVVGDGAPNLDNVTSLTLNWDLGTSGLYQFSLSTNNGVPGWYVNLATVSEQNFNTAPAQITFSNSGLAGLDGSYYVTISDGNFVLVSITGGFTIYCSQSETPPDCDDDSIDPTNTPPVAALTATPISGSAPLEVTFDASGSTDADNDALTYSINYGDGTVGTGAITTHTYESAGQYTAIVRVSDGNGGSDATSVTINVEGDDPTNTPPVASLIATPTEGTTPLEVTFDASGSTDADGDTLSYSIEYGDGTSGTGAVSTHTYTTGEYEAIVTVSDGQGGTDTASVTITVDDDDITIPGDCTFGAPISTALPSINGSYENTYVLGTGGPNMDMVTRFTVNWDLNNNGLYQFSFNLNTGPWYINFSSTTQNFSQPNPQITLTGTGIPGLDGDYYATVDDENFVLVAEEYTIYFSNSDTAPDCESEAEAKSLDKLTLMLLPNPAVTNVSILNKTDLKGNVITISDITGKEITSFSVEESTTNLNIDVSGFEAGLYMVRVSDYSGFSRALKLVVK